MTTRADVVAEARTWIGTPWQHQAMCKGVGCDCIGYLAGVALALGLADARPQMRDPAFRGYGRDPNPAVLLRACAEYLDPVPVREADLGDVLLMRVPRGVYAQHFGIVSRMDNGAPSYMLHATSAIPRRVVENRIDDAWRARIAAAYRFRGVD